MSAAPFFDDDLPVEDPLEDESAESLGEAMSSPQDDDDDEMFEEDDADVASAPATSPFNSSPAPPSRRSGGVQVGSLSPQGTPSRRSRGSRGRGGRTPTQTTTGPKWRSGQVPPAPTFDGDIDSNPYCLRHYTKRLYRWVRITKEFLPPNEQALRAREQMRGDAELELEETPDERYDQTNGIQLLLQDLQESFAEKELFRQGGAIREFESIGRLQGESITAFCRRFRILERKLQDNKVPAYPEQARVIKLLDGLRLDEKSTAALLLAAGNRYKMDAVMNAIKIQYPPGMSITGIPHRGHQYQSKKSGKPKHCRAWHADAEDWSYDDGTIYENEAEYAPDINQETEEPEYQDVEYDQTAEDEDGNHGEAEVNDTSEDPYGYSDEVFQAAVEALTVTSKRLSEITKARGFYNVNAKGKGKGKVSGKSSGKSKSDTSGGKKGSKGKTKGKGKGTGKPSPTPTRANLEVQQARIRDSTCLGCGSSSHWLRDCPHATVHSAQLTTAGVLLDAQGSAVDSHTSWMTFASETKEIFALPSLTSATEQMSHCLCDPHLEYSQGIITNPKVLLQYVDADAALMIADTGCQRQVAGHAWHTQRAQEIAPLQPILHNEHCKFSFGPNAGVPSSSRYVYPSGLAGHLVVLGISSVNEKAPALFSRPAFEALGAVPDLVRGEMHYTALKTSAPLFLSKCGHLAIRIDQWPPEPFEWTETTNNTMF